MADRRAQIEARLEAATPGPWYWEPPSEESFPQMDESLRSSARQESDGDERWDAVVLSGWGYDASGTDASDADRALIAHAPADLRWLLDALAAAEAERDALAQRLARGEALVGQIAAWHNTEHERAFTGQVGPEVRDVLRRVHDDLRDALGGEDA